MKEKIIAYIENDIAIEHIEEIEPQEDLLGNGRIDSMGMMKLLGFIEKETGFKIPPEDMTLENFMTIERILSYISKQKSSSLDEAQ